VTDPALALLDRVATLAGAPGATAAGIARRLGLVRDHAAPGATAWEGAPAVPGAARIRVRAGDRGAVDLVELDPGSGPTRAELEARFGRADPQPRAPGSGETVLAFDRGSQVTLLAYLDDDTLRARRLIVRRDG
jgi:hypothetical protein